MGEKMRELKFRAWDGQLMLRDWQECYEWTLNESFEKTEYSIMQYTGLKDRNGVEIYEGDILHTNCYGSDYMPNRVQTIVRDQECFGSLIFQPLTGACLCKENQNYFEIIGNIHENPEILND